MEAHIPLVKYFALLLQFVNVGITLVAYDFIEVHSQLVEVPNRNF